MNQTNLFIYICSQFYCAPHFLWILNQNIAKNANRAWCVHVNRNHKKPSHRYRACVIMLRPNGVFSAVHMQTGLPNALILCVCIRVRLVRARNFFASFRSLFQCINLIFTIDCIFHYNIAFLLLFIPFCCVQYKIKAKMMLIFLLHSSSFCISTSIRTYWWKKVQKALVGSA